MTSHFGIWILVTLPLVFASHNVLYVKKYKEESMEFVCDSEVKNQPPVGFYLKRKSPQREMEVLYSSPDKGLVLNDAFKGRAEVYNNLKKHQVNITVTSLSYNDSGVYACEFVHEENSDYITITGKTVYLLFIEAREESCSCSSYSFLLYAISAGTALFLIITVSLAVALCCKACHPKKPPNPLPIYEEMTGLRPDKAKVPLGHLSSPALEEIDSLMCDKQHVRLSKGNYYESPRKGLRSAQDADG